MISKIRKNPNPWWPSPTHPDPSPVLEGIIHDGLEHQTVPHLRWASEMEHLDGLEGRVGMTEPATGKSRETREMARTALRWLGQLSLVSSP